MDTNRLFDIILTEEKIEIDTVRISLPEGYKIERDIKLDPLSTPFGKYEVSTQIQNNSILYIRRLEMNKGRFPANRYNELLLFYEKIYNTDRAKLVLVKEAA